MVLSYKYAILRVAPDPKRGESVNVGLVVFADNGVDVRISKNLAKVAAIDSQVDLEELRRLPQLIADWTKGADSVGSRHSLLQNFGIITTSDLGEFNLASRTEYENTVTRIMKLLVNPVSSERSLAGNTRLKTTLRQKFKASGVLGLSETDIARHLVVPNYPIDGGEGLFADFALKNSVYHVTETADLRAEHISGIAGFRLVSLAAIKFDKAKDSFGAKTKRYAVYATRGSHMPSRAINLLADYSDQIFNIESRKEMSQYMEIIADAAHHLSGVRQKAGQLER